MKRFVIENVKKTQEETCCGGTFMIYIYTVYIHVYIHEYWPTDQVFAPDPLLLCYAQCRSTFHIDFAVLARAQAVEMIRFQMVCLEDQVQTKPSTKCGSTSKGSSIEQ